MSIKHADGGELVLMPNGRHVCTVCAMPFDLGDRGGARLEADIGSRSVVRVLNNSEQLAKQEGRYVSPADFVKAKIGI